jgi:hypothetical protein
MPIVTIELHELQRYADAEQLTALLRSAGNPRRGVLTEEWVRRLAVPLEARGFRVDGPGGPIHFWPSRDEMSFVFDQ